MRHISEQDMTIMSVAELTIQKAEIIKQLDILRRSKQ
jgi:hypothetical protein